MSRLRHRKFHATTSMTLPIMISPPFEDLVVVLQQTPRLVREVVADISDEDLRLKNSPEEFSILEHVCHLRDIDVEGYVARVKRILSEDKPKLPDIDGSRLAIERDYNRQSLTSALQDFSQARALNIQMLRTLYENQLSREGELEGVGRITLWQLLLLQREHDEEHLRELGVLRHHLRLLRRDTA